MKNKKTLLITIVMMVLIGTAILIKKTRPDSITVKNTKENAETVSEIVAEDEGETKTQINKDEKSNENRTEKQANTCYKVEFKHLEQNQKRDIEEFTNELNAFLIPENDANLKSVCVKVNQKPVMHKIRKKGTTHEVWIGSVVGPESKIELSYCLGTTSCKEACKVKVENKVDELLNEEEMAGLGDRNLEVKVNELRKVASANEQLLDSSVIREWNKTGMQEWSCKRQ